ncbi:cytochrome c oxidase subunit 4 isoform 2, mitochondrial-like isoform X2 [Argiope bruennichi]|uniref:Cytochrome c oxidase subunit 4 isoform 2 like protein n=1 Tax=Argiope bruennichi TaxID=94029 RepID=A0A8T0EN27_ARGBR|nr:cytochrome c oxidase subunit 4 isoform 2, mitochondrial-like isoform X2 [Argiope bruennichi]KAF8776858.1 Cytochrome c oxidase subunit 4 isoform 2 like protein [Argiope bruennichi]
MASVLYSLQSSIPRNLIRCLKHSSDITCFNKSKWRTVTSLSFNSGFVENPCVSEVDKSAPNSRTASLLALKQKEKGDWRNLTLEERQALYYMSFNQPFCDLVDEPADEWKLILAGTFTAMGLMILGMYAWISQQAMTRKELIEFESSQKT